MTQDYTQASAFVAALTGHPETIMDFRAINDRDKAVPAINRRGTLSQLWNELCDWNSRAYGILNCVPRVAALYGSSVVLPPDEMMNNLPPYSILNCVELIRIFLELRIFPSSTIE